MTNMLANKVALIAGGAGDVGEQITLSFLRQGARVVVPSRSATKLAQLRSKSESVASGELLTLELDVTTPEGIEDLIRQTQLRFGSLDGAVASLGSWHSKGELSEFTVADWNEIIAGGLVSHLNLARVVIPLLRDRPESFYFLVNGGAALTPVPHSGPVSIIAAAQLMLKEVLASESRQRPLRVNTLLVTSLVETRARARNAHTGVSAQNIGDYLAYLASAHGADIRGQTIEFGSREAMPPELNK